MATYVRVSPNEVLPPLPISSPHKAILVIDEESSSVWQAELSKALVKSRCLYMMAWGKRCSSWDDSVDLANLEAYEFGAIPEEAFVLTTWHEDETLQQIFEFAKFEAVHSTVTLEECVILHIGSTDRANELLEFYDAA